MKASIDEHGVLTVAPETPLEAYAIRKWSDGYNQDDPLKDSSSVLHIDTNLPKASVATQAKEQ